MGFTKYTARPPEVYALRVQFSNYEEIAREIGASGFTLVNPNNQPRGTAKITYHLSDGDLEVLLGDWLVENDVDFGEPKTYRVFPHDVFMRSFETPRAQESK